MRAGMRAGERIDHFLWCPTCGVLNYKAWKFRYNLARLRRDVEDAAHLIWIENINKDLVDKGLVDNVT